MKDCIPIHINLYVHVYEICSYIQCSTCDTSVIYICIYIYMCESKFFHCGNGHSSRNQLLPVLNFRELHVYVSRGPCEACNNPSYEDPVIAKVSWIIPWHPLVN